MGVLSISTIIPPAIPHEKRVAVSGPCKLSVLCRSSHTCRGRPALAIAGIMFSSQGIPRLGPLEDVRLACFTRALIVAPVCLETSATKPTELRSPRHGSGLRFVCVKGLSRPHNLLYSSRSAIYRAMYVCAVLHLYLLAAQSPPNGNIS